MMEDLFDQAVHEVRPTIPNHPKCSDASCPYDDNSYFAYSTRNGRYADHSGFHGLCLNCIDDQRRNDW